MCVCGGGGVVLLVLQVLKAATKPDLTKLRRFWLFCVDVLIFVTEGYNAVSVLLKAVLQGLSSSVESPI